jgi:hypothetical protein
MELNNFPEYTPEQAALVIAKMREENIKTFFSSLTFYTFAIWLMFVISRVSGLL